MEPAYDRSGLKIFHGDCREVLARLEPGSVNCCVTSPPYFGLRDYGIPPSVWGGSKDCEHEWSDSSWRPSRWGDCDDDNPGDKQRTNDGSLGHRGKVRQQSTCKLCGAWLGNLGLEPTPDLFLEHIVEVFEAVRRVLRDDGTLWFNMGDTYNHDAKWGGSSSNKNELKQGFARKQARERDSGCKPKDLIGIPWLCAFALRSAGWYLRADIIEEVELYCPCGCGFVLEEHIWRWSQDRDLIWKKLNPMPESVTDRPTKSHEYIFLLSKNQRYYYDAESIREPQSQGTHERFGKNPTPSTKRKLAAPGSGTKNNSSFDDAMVTMIQPDGKRNKRSVWSVATQAVSEAHFATFPEKLIEPCILAGCPEGGIVLDPFSGSGTTAMVCKNLGRRFIGCELNPDYLEISRKRIGDQQNLF